MPDTQSTGTTPGTPPTVSNAPGVSAPSPATTARENLSGEGLLAMIGEFFKALGILLAGIAAVGKIYIELVEQRRKRTDPPDRRQRTGYL